MRDGAMVIKWKADGTYDTLRPGTNRLVCYDQAGDAGERRSRRSARASATSSA